MKPGRAALSLALALLAAPHRLCAETTPIGGDHRLLLQFVEDGAVVQRIWLEVAAQYDLFQDGEDARFATNVAFRYGRDVEAGFVVSGLHRSREEGADLYGSTVGDSFSTTGFGDFVLYGKYRVIRSPFDLGVGAKVSVPLADSQTGLTSGAVLGSGFVGMRKSFASFTLVGHAGFVVPDESHYGDDAPGRWSATAGVGALVPITRLWVLIAEVDYDGARFDQEDASARALVGLDWRPAESMAVRGGVAAGLTDAGPRVSGVASFVFHY